MVPFTYIWGYLGKNIQSLAFSTIFGHFEGLFWPYFESVNGYDFNENGFGTP